MQAVKEFTVGFAWGFILPVRLVGRLILNELKQPVPRNILPAENTQQRRSHAA